MIKCHYTVHNFDPIPGDTDMLTCAWCDEPRHSASYEDCYTLLAERRKNSLKYTTIYDIAKELVEAKTK